MTHIILLGNEKGGSGKTTTAMHLGIFLLKMGFVVATIDTDIRQGSFSRYIENRKASIRDKGLKLQSTTHHKFMQHYDINKTIKYGKKDIDDIDKLIDSLKNKHHFIIIDTPGNDNILNRHLHYVADTVISPINDSFIDVDLLGKITSYNYKKGAPGVYTSMVWEQKKKKAFKDKKELKWIVVRNRLSFTDAINKKNISGALNALRKKFGFELSPGFSDRVIFKELFLNGLTLSDVKESKGIIKMNPSVISARQELRDFAYSLNFDEIKKKI